MTKTIVGVASALGYAGVAIIRLSGDKAAQIAKKLCKDKKLSFNSKSSHLMQRCKIYTPSFVDDGYVCFFAAPNSFTGEDVVEIFCHGGNKIAPKIMEHCIALGAVASEAGEFSKRSFANGRMTLDQAEGIINAIHAESDAQLAAANVLMQGQFAKQINSYQDTLQTILAGIDMLIDFGEDGAEEQEQSILDAAKTNLKIIYEDIQKTLNTARTGRLIKSGADVVIAGRPNSGKSSLLNAMTKSDCAIVTDIAGTTRDFVKASILHNGQKLNLCDTCGLRVTTDTVENIAVARTKEAIQVADLLIYLIDASVPITNDDLTNIQTYKNSNLIVVLNKIDLEQQLDTKLLTDFVTISVSANTNRGIDELKNLILKKIDMQVFDNSAVILTNSRHTKLLSDANINIKEAIDGIDFLPLDALSCILQTAYNHLGNITGKTGSDDIISQIFSQFCVGK